MQLQYKNDQSGWGATATFTSLNSNWDSQRYIGLSVKPRGDELVAERQQQQTQSEKQKKEKLRININSLPTPNVSE